ncbi:unnamed protein product [Closterium sp. NIES-65]|nr:unnamed protein product [Closterium sp. NIES-65]
MLQMHGGCCRCMVDAADAWWMLRQPASLLPLSVSSVPPSLASLPSQVLPAGESASAGCAVAIVDESLSVHVLLRGMVVVLPAGESAPAGCAVAIVDESLLVHVLLRGMVDVKAEAQKLGKRKGETAKLQEALAKKMGVPGLQEALAKKMGVPGLQEALAKKMGVPGLQEALAKKMGVPGLQEALAKKMGVPGYEEKVPSNVREENASKAAKLAAELASIDEAKKNFEKLMLDEASA